MEMYIDIITKFGENKKDKNENPGLVVRKSRQKIEETLKKLKILQLVLWLEQARLGRISNHYYRLTWSLLS